MLKNRLTRGNLLATLKVLKKHPRPKVVNPVPASVQAIVPASNPQLKKSKELASVIAQRRAILSRAFNTTLSASDLALLERLTTLHDFRMPYSGRQYGELFIHWFYRDRSADRLSRCEIFHLNMLQYFNVLDRVEVIHIRCASRGVMTVAMRKAVEILSSGKAEVDFKIVEPKKSWEHDTFKECVEYAVETGKFVYYTHFKGVSRMGDSSLGISGRVLKGSSDLDILYWCYLMYLALFDAPKGVKAIGPLLHLGKNKTYYNRDISWSQLCRGDEVFHYCGSFQAFSGEYIKDCLLQCKLGDVVARSNKLWVDDPYTVEMFLSMVSLKKDVYSLDVPYEATIGIYKIYSNRRIIKYQPKFESLYAPVCLANWSYRQIGGTESFNYALATALKELGCSVYYFAPDMDGRGVTEKHLQELGISPYKGEFLLACFANQNTGRYFVDKCSVIQTVHSAVVSAEAPCLKMKHYIGISEEVLGMLQKRHLGATLIRNGIDLKRFHPRAFPLHDTPKVLSICQGDDTLLHEACKKLGWHIQSVPKDPNNRIWHIEDLICMADIVVGIGRSLYDAMACGRVCISWDNRSFNKTSGCGYITEKNWYRAAKFNFTGKDCPPINTVEGLVAELQKYDPADGAVMRSFAEKELDVRKNAVRYLGLVGVRV